MSDTEDELQIVEDSTNNPVLNEDSECLGNLKNNDEVPSTSGVHDKAEENYNESNRLAEVSDDGDSDWSNVSDGSEICAICLSRIRGEVGSPDTNECEHSFCLLCILEWAKNNASCPQDRRPFDKVLVRSYIGGDVTNAIPIDEKEEKEVIDIEDNPTICEVCGNSDHEDRLLLCDGCDLGYHLYCLTPPLLEVPVEEWFCPVCDTNRGHKSDECQQPRQIQKRKRSRRQNDSHTLRTRVNRRRMIPRTRATERVLERISFTRKQKKKWIPDSEAVQSIRPPKPFGYLGDDDVDAAFNNDEFADRLLNSKLSSNMTPEERRKSAADFLRQSRSTPTSSYNGTRIPVEVTPSSSSSDVLGDILGGQSVLFIKGKDVSISKERHLVCTSEKSVPNISLIDDMSFECRIMSKPLPSEQSPSVTEVNDQDMDECQWKISSLKSVKADFSQPNTQNSYHYSPPKKSSAHHDKTYFNPNKLNLSYKGKDINYDRKREKYYSRMHSSFKNSNNNYGFQKSTKDSMKDRVVSHSEKQAAIKFSFSGNHFNQRLCHQSQNQMQSSNKSFSNDPEKFFGRSKNEQANIGTSKIYYDGRNDASHKRSRENLEKDNTYKRSSLTIQKCSQITEENNDMKQKIKNIFGDFNSVMKNITKKKQSHNPTLSQNPEGHSINEDESSKLSSNKLLETSKNSSSNETKMVESSDNSLALTSTENEKDDKIECLRTNKEKSKQNINTNNLKENVKRKLCLLFGNEGNIPNDHTESVPKKAKYEAKLGDKCSNSVPHGSKQTLSTSRLTNDNILHMKETKQQIHSTDQPHYSPISRIENKSTKYKSHVKYPKSSVKFDGVLSNDTKDVGNTVKSDANSSLEIKHIRSSVKSDAVNSNKRKQTKPYGKSDPDSSHETEMIKSSPKHVDACSKSSMKSPALSLNENKGVKSSTNSKSTCLNNSKFPLEFDADISHENKRVKNLFKSDRNGSNDCKQIKSSAKTNGDSPREVKHRTSFMESTQNSSSVDEQNSISINAENKLPRATIGSANDFSHDSNDKLTKSSVAKKSLLNKCFGDTDTYYNVSVEDSMSESIKISSLSIETLGSSFVAEPLQEYKHCNTSSIEDSSFVANKSSKKECTLEELNETQNKIKVTSKLSLEAKVIEEAKKHLNPYYQDKAISKDNYKEIISKCVNKVMKAESDLVVNPQKIQKLVNSYAKMYQYKSKKATS